MKKRGQANYELLDNPRLVVKGYQGNLRPLGKTIGAGPAPASDCYLGPYLTVQAKAEKKMDILPRARKEPGTS